MANEEPFDPNAGMSAEEIERERRMEEAEKAKNPELWKKNNEWLEQFIAVLESIPPEEAEKAAKMVERFIEGEITWAELQGMPPPLLYQIAEYGYLQFKRGKLKDAETVFKGLSVLDHKKGYYHTVLGAIYQKMDRLGDALAEYSAALELNPNDIVAYVNRGEIFYQLGYVEENLAIEDFDKAIALDPQGKDKWANRARFLKNLILQEREYEKSRESRVLKE